MRTTQQFSITLPNEMAAFLKAKIANGEYATDSEVIRDGLRILMARDRAVDRWLMEQAGLAHDSAKGDPSQALTAEQIQSWIARRLAKVTTTS